MSIRLKMTCQSKTDGKATIGDPENPGSAKEVDVVSLNFLPVTSGSDENKRFFAATPSGSLSINVANKDATASVEQGKEYFVVVSET